MNGILPFGVCLPVPSAAWPVGSLCNRIRAWAWGISQLRIDVALPEQDIDRELSALHERWHAQLSQMDVPAGLKLPGLGLSVRMRQADGEYFIYAIDTTCDRLAAYVVMSRLVELDRRTDRFLRSPHAKVARAYRRTGITSAIYRWWLASGRSLISGARQSQAASHLWRSLASGHPTVYVSLADRRPKVLPVPFSEETLDDIDTRLVLLGCGCPLVELLVQTPATAWQVANPQGVSAQTGI